MGEIAELELVNKSIFAVILITEKCAQTRYQIPRTSPVSAMTLDIKLAIVKFCFKAR